MVDFRIPRLKGARLTVGKITGSLQTTQDPNVPRIIPDTGIIISIILVIILVIIYYSISIENTDSIIYYCTCTMVIL